MAISKVNKKLQFWQKMLKRPCNDFTAIEISKLIHTLAEVYKKKTQKGEPPDIRGYFKNDIDGAMVEDKDAVDEIPKMLV